MHDVLLLGMKALEFILVEGDVIYADLDLQRVENRYELLIKALHNKERVSKESHKYETIKLSFGHCQMQSLEVGKSLALTQFDLEKIILISDEKKIAEGSLVNVDNKLAIKLTELV